MSYCPSDYYGETFATRAADEADRLAAAEHEYEAAEAGRLAAEMAFEETPHCELACFESGHTAHCAEYSARMAAAPAIAEPIAAAVGGWLSGYAVTATPRYAAIGNGLFVRTGKGKSKRRSA